MRFASGDRVSLVDNERYAYTYMIVFVFDGYLEGDNFDCLIRYDEPDGGGTVGAKSHELWWAYGRHVLSEITRAEPEIDPYGELTIDDICPR